jgi:DNA-binding transcriptional MerR regulator
MTRDQIRELRQRAYRRFYSRPAFLVRRLLRLRSRRELGVALQGAKALLWLWAGKDLFAVPPPRRDGIGA